MRHFTASGLVISENKRILMVKHRKFDAWLPPGGHVEPDETPDNTLLREILEETGVRARVVSNKRLELTKEGACELARPYLMLLEDVEDDGTHMHIDMLYLCTAMETTLHRQEEEVSDIGWFTYEQAAALKTFDNVRQTLKLLNEDGYLT